MIEAKKWSEQKIKRTEKFFKLWEETLKQKLNDDSEKDIDKQFQKHKEIRIKLNFVHRKLKQIELLKSTILK